MIRLALLAVLAASVGAGSVAAQPVYQSVRLDSTDPPTAVASPPDAAPLPDDWIARDKALHLGASFLLTLSGQYVLTDKSGLSNGRALPVAAGSALALGLLKEVADSRRPHDPHFCWRDLAADAAGVALAAAVVGL